jgi:hypothetical protein
MKRPSLVRGAVAEDWGGPGHGGLRSCRVPLIKNVIHRFHVKRPLTARERELRLDIRKPAGNAPHYQLSLIRLNSTFVECVDKWYAERGFGAMVGGGCAPLRYGAALHGSGWN